MINTTKDYIAIVFLESILAIYRGHPKEWESSWIVAEEPSLDGSVYFFEL